MGIEEQLPEDFEGRESFSKFPDLGALAKSYRAMEQKQGSMISKPQTPEDFGALMQKLGAPATPDGYVAELPEEELAVIREAAKEAHLTSEQFAKIAAARSKALQAQESAREAQKAELAAKYGDKLEEAKAKAARAQKNLGLEVDANDPTTFALLEKLGEFMSDSTVPQGNEQAEPETTPTEIGIKLREIMQSEAFNSRRHPEFETAQRAAMALRAELHKHGITSIHDPRILQGAPPSIARMAKRPSLFDEVKDN